MHKALQKGRTSNLWLCNSFIHSYCTSLIIHILSRPLSSYMCLCIVSYYTPNIQTMQFPCRANAICNTTVINKNAARSQVECSKFARLRTMKTEAKPLVACSLYSHKFKQKVPCNSNWNYCNMIASYTGAFQLNLSWSALKCGFRLSFLQTVNSIRVVLIPTHTKRTKYNCTPYTKYVGLT